LFADNASINDATITELSVIDEAVIGCDLVVGCNILMHNTTSPLVGNVLKDGQSFIQNAGIANTFVGINAGNFTVTGFGNSGFGENSLSAISDGFANTGV